MRSTLTTLVALASTVSATFDWNHASPFSCPSNTDNHCAPDQYGGFNWGGLNLGDFSSFGGFDFEGFSCKSSFGGSKKRDQLTGRTFQDKCIAGSASHDAHSSPSFSCGSSKDIDAFSVDEFQISVEFDCDLQFHYGMPDGSICKQTSSCSKSGTTVKNTQCGGAHNCTVIYPSAPSNPKPTCSIGIHSIGFDCSTKSTTKVHSTTTPPTYSTTSPPTSPTTTEATTTPESSPPVYSTSVSSTEVSTTPTTTESPTSPPTSTPTGLDCQPDNCLRELIDVRFSSSAVEFCATYTTAILTAPSAIPTYLENCSGSPAAVSSACSCLVASTTAPATETTPTSSPVYETSSTEAPTTTTTPEVPTSSEAPTTTPEGPTSSETPTTTLGGTTSYSSSEAPSTTPESSPVPTSSVEGSTTTYPGDVTTTIIVETSTTVCPVTLTHTTGGTTSIETGVSTSTILITSTHTVCTKCEHPTSTPAGEVTSTTPSGPATTAPCPEILPQCLSTWMFSAGCGSNADASCYCPSSDFVCNVFDCLSAHGATDADIASAQSYFQGICAPYLSSNPAIVTCAPSATTTGAGVPTGVPVTTIQVLTTIVVPCSESGTVIPSSSTTSVLSTQLVVPQVIFQTVTGTSTAGAELVVGTPTPAEVPAGVTTYPTAAATTIATVPISNGTVASTPSPSAFTGASSRTTATFGTLLAAALFAVFAM